MKDICTDGATVIPLINAGVAAFNHSQQGNGANLIIGTSTGPQSGSMVLGAAFPVVLNAGDLIRAKRAISGGATTFDSMIDVAVFRDEYTP